MLKRSLCLALLASVALPAQAFKVSPMVQEFADQGREATHNFVVENTTSQEIAIEVQLKKRGFDAQGEETRADTKDFSLYPPQFTLKAGAKRLIRVSYVGEAALKTEAAYRLIFQQLPVDFKTKGAARGAVAIDVLLRYVASLYVAPPDLKGRLEIADFSVRGDKLRVTLRNTGDAHQVLSKIGLRLVADSKQIDLPAASVEKTLGAENLLPGMSKSYDVGAGQNLDAKVAWKLQVLMPEGAQQP
jgi:P pilus assembly chaperone PapD